METNRKTAKKVAYTRKQTPIIRFRASIELHERLKRVAAEEELSVAALVRKFVLTTLEKFPS